jgi:hypothetical protein
MRNQALGPGGEPGPFALRGAGLPRMQDGPWFLQIAPQLMYLVHRRFTLPMQDRADIFEENFDVA